MSLATQMTASVKTGATLQLLVRNTLESSGLEDEANAQAIANEVTAFRSDIQSYLDEADTEEIPIRRKKINNVINDVSRITRDITGFSIKCTSRRGGHLYNAVEYKPRTKTLEEVVMGGAAMATPAPSSTQLELEIAQEMVREYRRLVDHEPAEMLKILVSKHGYEEVGKLIVPILQEDKAKEVE